MNVVVTKTTIVVKKSEENDKKNIATYKLMLQHYNELKEDISIATKENYVTKIKVAELEISIMTEKFYVAT